MSSGVSAYICGPYEFSNNGSHWTHPQPHGRLLVAVVGGALVIFVVSDFFDSGNKAFGGGDRSIGTIAGEEIDVQAFERRVDEQEEVYRSNGTTVDAQLQEQHRNNVWNEILRERTLLSRAKEVLR